MLKRLFDIVVSLIALIVLSPVLLFTLLAVRRSLGKPALFRQIRPGKGGMPFELVKFRSMTSERDAAGNLLPDEFRITPLGHKLRSSSLDELPELWNVLKGEMSLVGPRPLLMEYLPRYDTRQYRRHDVRPGITGWAQVHGRNALPWPQRLEHDVWYVENQSFWLDLKILAMTVHTVLIREGINSPGHATVDQFRGHPK
ncbi:sugar transferase [Pigmentiphaga aceris]|uniref:Sugar transferase n=1 Tax=Pigmentiphaga aceris TaxID=1940612 RepID=A0A5C0AZR3_9BURK|nr:sugar transferase [Pigmentiphaga aceris]QEI07186.1 sugar transferase [Pigmentiphaga aceris]